MATANGKKPDELARLVHDLEAKETLCHVKDYPEVTLEQLNEHLTMHGPIVNPSFGEQPAFYIDEGRFIPYQVVVYGAEKVVFKIAQLLGNWTETSGEGGRGTTSQRGFFFQQRPRRRDVRMPAVAYTPRDTDRNLDRRQVWTYQGDPFVPTCVAEVGKLSGQGSQQRNLDRKMRNAFQHDVQLGWLIDPRPGYRKMYEYYVNGNGEVQCSANTAWRDLDGRDVLPGFTLVSTDLEMVLDPEPGSSPEEEVDFGCPFPTCTVRLRSYGENAAHAEWHRAESARQRFRATH